ncbi:2962_t:CDS:2, partial [Funneliformis caledonium]
MALAKSNLNLIQEIIHSVGSLSCSQGKRFYVLILAGTIQAPLKKMIKELTYNLLRLLLLLLSDGEMNDIGIINLEMIPDNPSMSYIRIPYIWMWILTLLAKFKVLCLQLLKELYKTIILQKLFKDVYYNAQEILLDHKFQLLTVEEYYVKFEYRYLNTMQHKHLSFGIVFKNGEGVLWDIFFFLNDYLIAIQNMVENEYKKVEEEFEILQNSYTGIKQCVLLIYTNESKMIKYLEDLKDNYFVIDYDNFKDFYRYTFSTCTEFSADNEQLNANTVKIYELRIIRGIEEAIAINIHKKRPFDDENDLYDKVKNISIEIRKKIKVTIINKINL